MWNKIEEIKRFAEKYLAENRDSVGEDEWITFDETTDINIFEEMELSYPMVKAIAYPVDEDGNILTNETSINLF